MTLLSKTCLALLSVSVMAVSCKKENTNQQNDVENTVLQKIKAQGFSTDNVRKVEEGYLVEGDIVLTEENLNDQSVSPSLLIANSEQYRTTNLVKALPKMAKAATSQELRSAIIDHLDVTITQVSRLEQVFELLGEKTVALRCDAMEGIVKEGERVISDTQPGTNTRDVGIILAAQKVEHYEISTYGGLAQMAITLGLDEIANLLQETLAEEKEADQHLTNIAENDINYEASGEENNFKV